MRRVLPPVALLFVIVLVPHLRAQQKPTERYVEEIEVRVINVDVVVTDRKGNPIGGLEKRDFELFENGRPVEISYFLPVSEGNLKVEGAAEAPAAGQPTPGESVEQEAPKPVTWAVFIDQTNIRPALKNQALQQLESFLRRAVSEGDRGIVGSFDGVGFRVRNRDARDSKAMFAALDAAKKEPVHLGSEHVREQSIRTEMATAEDSGDLADAEAPKRIADEIQLLIQEESQRARMATLAAGSMIDMLTGLEGRVALIYVGGGFTTLPAMRITEEWRKRWPNLLNERYAPRPEQEEPKLQADVTKLLNRVLATRAAMYAILARDAGPSMIGAEDRGPSDLGGPVTGSLSAMSEQATVREMADRTGGRTFKVAPNLDRQLDVVRADMSHYYSLGYTPTGPPDQTRNIRVVVKPEGLRIRYREAVRERTPKEQAGDAVVAALFEPEKENPLGVTIEAGEPHKAGRTRVLPLKIQIPLGRLTFLPAGEVNRGGVSFEFATVTKKGALRRLDSRELPLEIPTARMDAARSEHITYSVEIPLQADGTRISVSVLDSVGQTRSILTVPVEKSRE